MIMGPILFIALFRYIMLDLTPIARSIVFDEIKDPTFVLDNENRLVDHNHTAENLLINSLEKLDKMIADELFKELRTSDFLGRYGGEEFLVILPETKKNDTAMIAERLNKSIAALAISYNRETISITISLGSYTIKGENQIATIENAISNADEALYRAKDEGRNRVVDYDS